MFCAELSDLFRRSKAITGKCSLEAIPHESETVVSRIFANDTFAAPLHTRDQRQWDNIIEGGGGWARVVFALELLFVHKYFQSYYISGTFTQTHPREIFYFFLDQGDNILF